MIDRVPPQSLEMERSVLGAMLIEARAIEVASGILQSSDFYQPAHGDVFDAILSVHNRREAVDIRTVQDELLQRQVYEQVGGVPFLVTCMDMVPHAGHVEAHARIVAERSLLRGLLDATKRIREAVHSDYESLAEVTDACEEAILGVTGRMRTEGGLQHIGPAMNAAYGEFARRMDGSPAPGISLGFQRLDWYVGGLNPGDLMILAARPSVGKTALALAFADHVSRAHGPVAFFSLEMNSISLAKRLASSGALANLRLLRSGKAAEEAWIRFGAQAARISASPLYVDEAADLRPLTLRSRARRLRAEHGLALIIVDYIQLMVPGERAENRNQELAGISKSLKETAKRLQVPVIALSQLSRAPEKRANKRPGLSDIRDSGAIEADADIVAMLYSEDWQHCQETGEERADREIVECAICKHRNGPVGTARLMFQPPFARFDDLEENR